jgi:hypothetical protein
VTIENQDVSKEKKTAKEHGKLSEAGIIKILEQAIEEMVRFEVSDQSPYA